MQSKSLLVVALCTGVSPVLSLTAREAPAITSILVTTAFLLRTARCNAVWPLSLGTLNHSLLGHTLMSVLIALSHPWIAAMCSCL